MPLDAVMTQALTAELREVLPGARIEKIQQPARDQIVLILRGNRRLLLCAGANAPRAQMTELRRDNPEQPPMFCMLLRKHLSGGRIVSVEQPPLERLIRLEIDAADEFGQTGRRTLVLEAMGRRSNLILLDGDGRILDCLRRVDAEMSASRQVLPGLFYEPPPSVGRLPFTEETEDGFRAKLASAHPERPMEKFLLDCYFGFSPLLARELAFRACGETDGRLSALDGAGVSRFWEAFQRLADTVRENRFTPILLRRDGVPVEFCCVPILQYGPAMESEPYSAFSALLDAYYGDRERRERIRARGAELIRTATTARDRLRRKLALQETDYAAAQNRDLYRLRGDLITANLYRMTRGQARLVCENFYGEPGGTAEVPLDPLLTPQQNAARYYKRYTKAKTAEKYLTEQMAIARRDLEYLESVLEELDRAETEQDFVEIRRELRDGGFLRAKGNRGKDKREERRLSAPREYRTRSGFQVQAGRNNRQNDALTKGADRRDLWFHTQKIHGAHVLLRTEGRTPDEGDILDAAAIAAYHSQARESGSVPVDWTVVRNVKKPAGGRPGMAVYTSYRSVYVTPGLPETGGKP